MKAKVHNVTLFSESFLIMARSKAGALKAVFEQLKDDAHVEVATGQQVYEAGRDGVEILDLDKFVNVVDPNQPDLPGIDDDDEQLRGALQEDVP